MANKDGTYTHDEYLKDVQEMSPNALLMKYGELSVIRYTRGIDKLRELESWIETALRNDFRLDKLLVKTWLDEIKEIRKLL